nr:PREDICTED: jerky protein homolog-like [Megachile rotundata]
MHKTGDFISDALLLEKAAELKEEIGAPSHFKTSAGWLAKFKRRHGIRLVHLYGEQDSADRNAAERFVTNFRKLVNEENIDLNNIYNMDESGLLWKALPEKTLVSNSEGRVSGQKLKKERVTVGFCANVTGTHKLMPIFINKYKKPRALQNITNKLPVVFKAQSNAWMVQELFVDWFDNHFKKSVQLFQLENGLSGKVILLIDNCSSHRFPANYTHEDKFEIMYLPPNTTALI